MSKDMRKRKLGGSITKRGQSELFSDDQNIFFWNKILTYYWSMLVMLILSLWRRKQCKKVVQCAARCSGPIVVTRESLHIRQKFFYLREGKHWQRCPGNWESWFLEMFRAGPDSPKHSYLGGITLRVGIGLNGFQRSLHSWIILWTCDE